MKSEICQIAGNKGKKEIFQGKERKKETNKQWKLLFADGHVLDSYPLYFCFINLYFLGKKRREEIPVANQNSKPFLDNYLL